MIAAAILLFLPVVPSACPHQPGHPAPPIPVLTLRGHSETVLRVQFSPDGRRLATAAGDKTAGLWDAASGKKLFTLDGHTQFVGGLAFSPDGTRLATAHGDGSVRLWSMRQLLAQPPPK